MAPVKMFMCLLPNDAGIRGFREETNFFELTQWQEYSLQLTLTLPSLLHLNSPHYTLLKVLSSGWTRYKTRSNPGVVVYLTIYIKTHLRKKKIRKNERWPRSPTAYISNPFLLLSRSCSTCACVAVNNRNPSIHRPPTFVRFWFLQALEVKGQLFTKPLTLIKNVCC